MREYKAHNKWRLITPHYYGEIIGEVKTKYEHGNQVYVIRNATGKTLIKQYLFKKATSVEVYYKESYYN